MLLTVNTTIVLIANSAGEDVLRESDREGRSLQAISATSTFPDCECDRSRFDSPYRIYWVRMGGEGGRGGEAHEAE